MMAGIVCVGVAGSTEQKSTPAAPRTASSRGTAALAPGEPAGTPDREPTQRPGPDSTAKAADDDIEQLKQRYDEQKKAIQQDFQKRRQELGRK